MTTTNAARECKCSNFNKAICEKRAARGLVCFAFAVAPEMSAEQRAERVRDGWRHDHGITGGRRRAT